MRANRLDVISIADIENIVNAAADNRYTTAEIMLLLQVNEKVPITRNLIYANIFLIASYIVWDLILGV